METKQQPIIEVYTEYTPNPESLKFVVNKMLSPERSADFRTAEEATGHPLAEELFTKNYVQGVFISGNFVTITKNPELEWIEIVPEMRAFLKDYVTEGKPVLGEFKEETAAGSAEDLSGLPEIDQKIIGILNQYVKPAVEMDGGNIEFKSFEEGRVTLIMQGSCSGCPSATLTLKQGIEGLLKKMVPEVKEVVANMG